MAEILNQDEIFFTPFEPKTKNRFIMYIEDIPSYFVKTASRPQITFEEIELNHINILGGDDKDIISIFDLNQDGVVDILDVFKMSKKVLKK